MKVDETAIIVGLKQGDEKAYQYVFSHYYTLMCHMAANFLQDEFTVETVVSDVISHLYEARDRLNVNRSLQAFLVMSTRNACINYLGTKINRREQAVSSIGTGDMSMFYYISSQGDPLGSMLEDEMEQDLEDVINSLPEMTGRVFRKSRFEGKSYNEIAEEEGVSINSIQYHMKRSLLNLHEKFEKKIRRGQ